ncbi:MAG: hypothetical protein J6Q22_05195 [Prevotella sp.]|nr:hypothetical protein [Prevotella sp.]
MLPYETNEPKLKSVFKSEGYNPVYQAECHNPAIKAECYNPDIKADACPFQPMPKEEW